MSMFVVLSAVAGFVDAACFLALSKVFTAHVTGNLAALASALVKPDETTALRIAVIVAFAGGGVCAVIAARIITIDGRAAPMRARRAVILVEAAWLALLLASQAVLSDGTWARYAVALCAGAAMGCQSALSKLPGELSMGTPTTVMTSNFSAWTIALVERMTRRHDRDRHDRTLVQLSLQLLLFVAGAAAGALGLHRFGIAVLGVPLALLLGVVLSCGRSHD
ncbi:hypothetical protein C9I57_25500 [Trinickia symbiotica]|uniref:DUF1275 domain-containing protein n=1 Tax=Trinickia symbiotica TaxID=863227 RepID=A0A2T3XN12_9BURK|nr:YoaK family protein [Trinickia symbiotica]PTB17885.1 hypothetical protein C9I57_25500 [Trinickia symbiotica]